MHEEVPLVVDDTDYLNLFWSGKDSLHLSRSWLDHESPQEPNVIEMPDPLDIDTRKVFMKKGMKKNSSHVLRDNHSKNIATLPTSRPDLHSQKLLPIVHPKRSHKLLTEEEIQHRVDLLSRPITNKTEAIVPPPQQCVDGPQLSFSCVDYLQQQLTNNCEFESIPLDVTSLQLHLDALTGNGEEWESGSRHAFQEIFSCRKDMYIGVDSVSTHQRVKIIQDSMFSKRDKKSMSSDILKYNGFMHRYCIGFMCLAFDLRMQLIGTYDLQYGNFISGVTFCPPNIDSHLFLSKSATSLLRINLESLPRNAFAIVPILYDQAGHLLPDLMLSISLLVQRNSVWSKLSDRMSNFVGIRTSRDEKSLNSNSFVNINGFKEVISIYRMYYHELK